MKVRPPVLSPLLRSDNQGRLLAELFLFPERELSISELARRAGVSLPTALREVDRMAPMGFLNVKTVGRNKMVRANADHVLFRPVETILRYAYGPLAVLPGLLRDISGIAEAYVYGSWAARLDGEPGHDPADIDVLVVGEVDRTSLFDAASVATARLSRPVNAHIVSPGAWQDETDLFIRTVKSRPLVRIPLEGDST
jgi:predicted nucleotidyltransferase